jgi:hypothetical protein
MLRHAFRAAAGLILAASLCGEAAAWQVGNWTGRLVYSETGAFSGCRMSVTYDSGITLHFLQLRGDALLIGMSRPDWSLNPDGAYDMGLVIDGRYVRRARGTVLPSLTNAVFLALGHDRATRDLLRRRFHLTLVNNRQDFAFSLTGTAAALARLERCVRTGA